MKSTRYVKPIRRIAVVESNPLRLSGLRAVLESESDLQMVPASIPEIASHANIDVVLIGDRPGCSLFDALSELKRMRPNLPIIVVGPSANDEVILNALVSGAKGYVFDGAPPSEFAQAIRVVSEGLVWAPRRVLSMFIELACAQPKRMSPRGSEAITDREKEVLKMLVSGLSNKKLGHRSALRNVQSKLILQK